MLRWDLLIIYLLIMLFATVKGNRNESSHDKTNTMACAPSEDSYQFGHPPSLIRVFAVSMKKDSEYSNQTRRIPSLI